MCPQKPHSTYLSHYPGLDHFGTPAESKAGEVLFSNNASAEVAFQEYLTLPPKSLILHFYPKESMAGGGQWTEVRVSVSPTKPQRHAF